MNPLRRTSVPFLSLSLLLLATPAAAQGSDSCSSSQMISGAGPHSFDLTSATTGAEGQSAAACNFFGSTAILTDVWFRWTAPSTAAFMVSTCQQTDVDTKIAVYVGTTCPPATPLACDDDWCGVQSLARIQATTGQTFLIQIGTSPFGSPGTGTFRILPAPSLAADECGSPASIGGTGFFAFDTNLASTGSQGQSNPGCVPVTNDMWYSWSAPISGMAQFDTCGQTSADTRIAVYSGTGCPAATSIACGDDECGNLHSLVQWPVSAGAPFMLQIGGSSSGPGNWGTFRLGVDPPPAHDSCATPADVSQVGTTFDNTTATTGTQGQTNPCGQIARDLWFFWTASVNGTATIDTCGQTSMNTSLAVYPGSGCPGGPALACSDDGCGGAQQSDVTIPVSVGSVYTIQIGSSPGSLPGSGSFSIVENGTGGGPMTQICLPGEDGIIPCPCSNPPAGTGKGCNNFGGAPTDSGELTATGTASLGNDSVVLQATGENNTSLTVFWQGRDPVHPTGLVHGAGVRCVTVALKRLYTGNASGGAISRPGGADPSVSVRSAAVNDPISAGQNRHYFTIYRDPNAAGPCGNTASTINLTNAGTIFWGP